MSYPDYIDFDPEPEYFKRNKIKQKPVWTTHDGETLFITELEDSHLQNIINYLTRKAFEWQHACDQAKHRDVDLGRFIVNNRYVDDWLEIFYAEVKRRQGEN